MQGTANGRYSRSAIGLWFLIAFAIRIAYSIWIWRQYGLEQCSDFLYMHQLAESLSNGDGFTIAGTRVFNQSVGYPAMLAALYWLFGAHPTVMLVSNALLGATSVALVFAAGKQLIEDIPIGQSGIGVHAPHVAAAVAALYPDSLLYCTYAASENLLVPLLLAICLLVMQRKHDVLCAVSTGMVAAAASNVKAHVILLCPALPCIWVIQRRRYLLMTGLAACVGGICLLPWTVINYRASDGHIIPFAAVAGEVFLASNNPTATGGPTSDYHLDESIEQQTGPVELDRLRFRKGLAYIRNDPAWFVELLLQKLARALSPARDFMFEYNEQPRLFTITLSRWATTAFNGLLLLSGLLAGWVLRRYPAALMLWAGIVGASLAGQLIFCAYPRYRYPFLFALLPLVGCAAHIMISRAQQEQDA